MLIRAKGTDTLTEDQLRARVPSIFAEQAHASRSGRYTFIPTVAVLRGMAAEGFLPVAATQSRSRDESKTGHTKHMIRFRKLGDAVARQVGDVFPEVVLVNSHDGTSAYNLMAGLFRLICLNGAVVSDRSIDAIKVHHKGDVVGQVIEGAYTVISESVKALEAPRQWSQLQLSSPERLIFAEQAHALRFEETESMIASAIKPEALLSARRREDTNNDLWTVYNRVQENVIRGGLTGTSRDAATGRRRRHSTRPVNGIDQDVRLNKALWALASKMAELKAA